MLGADFDGVLARARVGDETAFVRLYRDVHPVLVRYLAVMAADLADDAASETWLEVARGLDAFDGGESAFRGWLFTIARSKVVDRIRYESRRPSSVTDDVESWTPASRDTAEEVEEYDATRRAVALVATLPADQAEAVMLHVVVGLGYADVASLMRRTSGSVRVLVHRGLRRLERDLVTRPVHSEGGVTA